MPHSTRTLMLRATLPLPPRSSLDHQAGLFRTRKLHHHPRHFLFTRLSSPWRPALSLSLSQPRRWSPHNSPPLRHHPHGGNTSGSLVEGTRTGSPWGRRLPPEVCGRNSETHKQVRYQVKECGHLTLLPFPVKRVGSASRQTPRHPAPFQQCTPPQSRKAQRYEQWPQQR